MLFGQSLSILMIRNTSYFVCRYSTFISSTVCSYLGLLSRDRDYDLTVIFWPKVIFFVHSIYAKFIIFLCYLILYINKMKKVRWISPELSNTFIRLNILNNFSICFKAYQNHTKSIKFSSCSKLLIR